MKFPLTVVVAVEPSYAMPVILPVTVTVAPAPVIVPVPEIEPFTVRLVAPVRLSVPVPASLMPDVVPAVPTVNTVDVPREKETPVGT